MIMPKMLYCFLFLYFTGSSFGLFEDQVGKFDWRHQYVGEASFVEFDSSSGSGRRIILATEDNVLAAIASRSGALEWRQVLERAPHAHIDDMLSMESAVVLVQGGGTYVRSFSSVTGDLVWENNVQSADPKQRGLVESIGSDNVAVVAGGQVTVYDLQTGSEQWTKTLTQSDAWYMASVDEVLTVMSVQFSTGQITVTSYDATGAQIGSSAVPAPWFNARTSCIVEGGFLACVEGGSVYSLDVSKPNKIQSTSLQSLGLSSNVASVESVSSRRLSSSGIFALRLGSSNMAALKVTKVGVEVVKAFPNAPAIELNMFLDKTILLTTSIEAGTESLTVQAYDVSNGQEVSELRQSVLYSSHHGMPRRLTSHLYRRKDGQLATRMLISGEEHSLTLLATGGRLAWSREEALAHILSVEMVDLPVPPSLANMEEEFASISPDNLVEMFVKRISTQLTQLRDGLLSLRHRLRLPRNAHAGPHDDDDLEDLNQEEDDSEQDLTRDDFNLHKMIVLTTAAGKLYGMETYSGRLVWKHLVPGLAPFSRVNKQLLPVFVLRTTAHFPLAPYCTVVGQNKVTGEGLIFSFDPITGHRIIEEDLPTESMHIQQVYQLHHMDENFLRPIVILTKKDKYVVVPHSDSTFVDELSSQLYMFTSDTEKGTVQGYAMKPKVNANGDKELIAEALWNVNLHHDGHVITNVAVKRAAEHVHSQGVVLGDRSVLYKYINPNLVAVTTESQSGAATGDESVSVYLIDGVTGQLVFHCQHKKARGPVHVVHSENWLVYDYWNVKKWRVEVAVIELYEGAQQSNSTAFSSLIPPPTPIVMRQAFIFSAHIAAMTSTLTERGLTNKQVIMALESGGVLGMPKMMLDARRPVVPTAEHREEGLMPYMPELARPFEAMINYNLTLHGIRGIHTAAAGLESTSLVFCYGLDLFFTRVTPSKLFDVLNDDFDYLFIGSVTAGMILVSIITRKLAARKALNRAWK